ncbi:MAG: hypothetical protein E7042_09350 [Lentisphaerae bacterium]|nr:hypothetical protein [Lentisphaerota bacterium]
MNHNQRIFLAGIIGVIVFTAPLLLFSHVSKLLLTSYVASLVATAAVTAALYLGANRKQGMFVTTAGMILVVWIYAFSNLFYSGVILLLHYTNAWQMPVKWFILGHIILAALCAWKLLAADAGKEEIEKSELKLKENISQWKNLQMQCADLALKSPAPVRKTLENVKDAIRYADPVTAPQLAEIESAIAENITRLSQALQAGDNEKTEKLSGEILLQIKQRSEIAKSLK